MAMITHHKYQRLFMGHDPFRPGPTRPDPRARKILKYHGPGRAASGQVRRFSSSHGLGRRVGPPFPDLVREGYNQTHERPCSKNHSLIPWHTFPPKCAVLSLTGPHMEWKGGGEIKRRNRKKKNDTACQHQAKKT